VSSLNITELSRLPGALNYGLKIEPRENTRAQSLDGKRISTDKRSSIYPGLPLFKKAPFETHQEGEKVTCDSITLRFPNRKDRGLNLPLSDSTELYLPLQQTI
jgi:hypothetical protein